MKIPKESYRSLKSHEGSSGVRGLTSGSAVGAHGVPVGKPPTRSPSSKGPVGDPQGVLRGLQGILRGLQGPEYLLQSCLRVLISVGGPNPPWPPSRHAEPLEPSTALLAVSDSTHHAHYIVKCLIRIA